MARKLAVVPAGTTTSAPPPTDVVGAANHSERAFLVALRTKIAKEIDNGLPPAYLAPLSRQIKELDRDIRALDARLEEERDDEDNGPVPDAPFDPETI